MRFLYVIIFVVSSLFSMAAFAAENVIYTEDKTAFSVSSDAATFTLKLKSNPTTGYTWFLTDYNSALIEPIQHTFDASANKKLIGAPGFEIWTFHVKPAGFLVPQQTLIRMIYARPWDSNEPVQTVTFRITTISAPSASHPQK